MMNVLYYDCFSGISGDMNLAAMIDLGVDPDVLRRELSKLGVDDAFELKISNDSRHGISGTRVDVLLKHGEGGHHDTHAHHGDHGHRHKSEHHHHHDHRNLKHIQSLIEESELDDKVKQTAVAIFRKVAEAEAKVHGKGLYEVHFHEVGAVDSIVDIVGAAICFHALDIDAVWCSSVELGGGVVSCDHGTIPVPAPATVEILKGCPTTRGAVKKETTTPTGAAIVATLTDRFTDSPQLIVEKSAYGVGHRDTKEIPNLLRIHLATAVEAHLKRMGKDGVKEEERSWLEKAHSPAELRTISARLLQCNIDDMTGEMLGVVMETLMESGAMDVHFTPIIMKKNRPATQISLLCESTDEDKFKHLLFRHTTTLGIKSFPIEKTELEVSFEILETSLGNVTMKNAVMDGQVIRSKPELEDCKTLAARHDIPLAEVYLEIGKCRNQ